MADLPPGLSSDEENAVLEDDSDEESVEEDKLDDSFEFGGILGEDGGVSSRSGVPKSGWSYETALQKIQSSDGSSQQLPRIDVSDLIAAKRKSFEAEKKKKKQNEQSQHEEVEQENDIASDSNDSADDDSNERDNDEEGNSDSESSSSDEDDDDDDNDESKLDDSHRDLEDDVLRTRAGKMKDEESSSVGDDAQEDDNDDEEQASSSSDSDVDEKEEAKEAAFYEQSTAEPTQEIEMFAQLTLSRPLLRGVAAMGFVKPTPIQAAVIPVALSGKDICASAVTGSGKTAAFLLPILERLLHRQAGRIKAIILTPTRELAAQCVGMCATFAQHTKIRSALIVGGTKNVNAQAAELRARPDLVVATPGRLLDHVMNTPGVTLEDVDFLVLDEADRLLDLGFQEEVHELIKNCPVQRQTMLFSATLNTKVDDLIHLSLKRPVRIRISDNAASKNVEVAPRLEQEFIRIRASNEGINREGMLLALLTRTFTSHTIVFFETKATAHRMMIICGLCGLKCSELHGNLTQQQRLAALEDFRSGNVDVLLATDLAARGLDVDRVETVINFEMPSQIETYIHRIGRTARAGRGGRSCTLIGEGRRHLMKEIIKDADAKAKRGGNKSSGESRFKSGVIRSRAIPAAVVSHFVEKIRSLGPHIQEVLQAEAVARMDRLAEMEAIKAQNIIEHADEIKNRPQREWFASERQKKLTKEAAAEKKKMIEEKVGTGVHRMTRKKRRAREALQALNASTENDNDDDAAGGNDDAPAPKVNTKILARQKKRKLEESEKERHLKSVHDLDMESEKRKKPKGVRAADAMGDSNLFAEERVTFISKKASEKVEAARPKSYFDFKGYDPDKKLGKKKSHHKFKSKSKYRRRK